MLHHHTQSVKTSLAPCGFSAPAQLIRKNCPEVISAKAATDGVYAPVAHPPPNLGLRTRIHRWRANAHEQIKSSIINNVTDGVLTKQVGRRIDRASALSQGFGCGELENWNWPIGLLEQRMTQRTNRTHSPIPEHAPWDILLIRSLSPTLRLCTARILSCASLRCRGASHPPRGARFPPRPKAPRAVSHRHPSFRRQVTTRHPSHRRVVVLRLPRAQ